MENIFLQTYKEENLTKKSSITLSKMRSVCIIIVVLVHSNVAHLVSNENAEICNDFIKYMTYFPRLNIMLILSGFFFFAKDNTLTKNIYKNKLKNRINTLLIPYIIWCVFGYTYNRIAGVENEGNIFEQIQQILWGTPIMTGHPSGRALWYVRNLMVFAILSPLYYAIVKYLRHFTLVIVVITSIYLKTDFPFYSPYILLGAYIAINEFSFEKICNSFSMKVMIPLTIAIYFLYIYKMLPGIIATIVFIIMLYKIFEQISIPPILIKSSTLLYMSHLYITTILRKLLIAILPNNVGLNLLAIIITWVSTVMLCIGAYYIMKRYTPRFLATVTGGRI